MDAIRSSNRLESLPHGLSHHLRRIFLEERFQGDIHDHLFVLDLFSRYVLFIPLAYYLHRLREPESPTNLVDTSLCNYITDCLGTRRTKGGAPGLTPFNSLELAGRVADHLARTLRGDPVTDAIAGTHRKFSSYGKRQRRIGLHEEPEKIFKRQRDHLCHAKSILSQTNKKRLCAEWRKHLEKWLHCELFELVALAAETISGQAVSLMYRSETPAFQEQLREGSELFVFRGSRGNQEFFCEFPAFPFIRVTEGDHAFNTLFLSYYLEKADGSGVMDYTDSTVRTVPEDRPPDLTGTEFSDNLNFPWIRFKCTRSGIRRQVPAGRSIRVTLTFENQGSEEATVNSFTEILPKGARTADGSEIVEVDEQTVQPGESREINYELVFEKPYEGFHRFQTRQVLVEQNASIGRVPIAGKPEIACIPALPPALHFSRRILRRFRDGWLAVDSSEQLVCGELVRVEVSIEDPGDDLDQLVYSEFVSPGAVSEIVNTSIVGAEGTPAVKILEDGITTVCLDIERPFSETSLLRLVYDFITGPVEEVTIVGELEVASRGGNSPRSVHLADPETRRQISEINPAVEIRLLSCQRSKTGEPDKSDELSIEIEVENRSRQVLRRADLHFQFIGIPRSDQPASQPLDTLIPAGVAVRALLAVPLHSDRLLDFSVDLEYSSSSGERQRLLSVLGRSKLGRLWRSPRQLRGFQGREQTLKDLRRKLFHHQPFRPVYLYGEAGTGKMRLLDYITEPEFVGSQERIIVEGPIICLSTDLGPYYQLLDIVKQLCLRVARVTEEASDLTEEDQLNMGLETLGIDGTGKNQFLRLLIIDQKGYLEARDEYSISEDLFHFFRKFYSRQLQVERVDPGRTAPRMIVALQQAAGIGSGSARLLQSLHERLRRAPVPVYFLLSDSHFPDYFKTVAHPLRLRAWNRDEFFEVCQECFLHPRLSSGAVDALYLYSGGNPRLAGVAIDHLLKEADESLTVEDGIASLQDEHLPIDISEAINQEMIDDLEAFIENTQTLELETELLQTVAFLNCIEGSIDRESALKLMSRFFPREKWNHRKLVLDLITEYGWAGAEGQNRFLPCAGLTKREIAKNSVEDPSRLHDLLLEHYYTGDQAKAVLHLPHAGCQARTKYFQPLLARAFRELEQAHHQTAHQQFCGLTTNYDDVPISLQRLAIYGRVCAEWQIGNRAASLHWRDQLTGMLEDRAGLEREVGISGRSIDSQLALVESWSRACAEHSIQHVLEPLRAYLINGEAWRRMCCLFPRVRRRVLRDSFDHHLLALRQLFFARSVDSFLFIYQRLYDTCPSLSWRHQMGFLEALWSLAEDPRAEEVIRATTPRPTKIMGVDHQEPSPLERVLDHERLMDQTRTLLEQEELPSPLWLGRIQLRRWKLEWARTRSSPEEMPPAEKVFDLLDQAIEIFENAFAVGLEADALRAKGEALQELFDTTKESHLRDEAYAVLKKAADRYNAAGRKRMDTMTQIAAVHVYLDHASEDLLESMAQTLLKDLESVRTSAVLSEEEVREIRNLLLELSWRSHDQERTERYLREGEPGIQVSAIAYLFRKELAVRSLSEETCEGDLDAHKHLLACLKLLDRWPAYGKEEFFPTVQPIKLHLRKEKAAVWGMLSKTSISLSYFDDALCYIAKVLGYIADKWHAATGELDWSELAPGHKNPEAVLLVYFRYCLDVWKNLEEQGDVSIDLQNDFFRKHILERFGTKLVLRQCWELYASTLKVPSDALQKLDSILLEAEVAVRLDEPLPANFEQILEQLSECSVMEEFIAARVIKHMRRTLHIILSTGRDFEEILAALGRVAMREPFAHFAIRALAYELLQAQAMLTGALEEGGSNRTNYLEAFSDSALELLKEFDESNLDPDTLNNLVRLCLMFPKFHHRALHWMQQLGASLIDSKDERDLLDGLSLLCSLVAEEEPRDQLKMLLAALAPVSSDPHYERILHETDEAGGEAAAIRESGIELCRHLVAECRKPGTWISSEAKQALLFHLVEKVVPNAPENRDIKLVTALVLYRRSAQIDSSALKLLVDAWTPRDLPVPTESEIQLVFSESHSRAQIVLAVTHFLYYRAEGFMIRDDLTYIWNTLISSRTCQRIISRFLNPRLPIPSRLRGYSITTEESDVLRCLHWQIHLETRLWATGVARSVIPSWGTPEMFSSWQIKCVLLLAESLLGISTDVSLSFAKAYVALEEYVGRLPKNNWQEALHRTLVEEHPEAARMEGIGGTSVPSLHPLKQLSEIGLSFIERIAAMVWSLTVDELLIDVDKRLSRSEDVEHDEFIGPSDLDVSLLSDACRSVIGGSTYLLRY